jgi:hypothetical protein
MFIKCKGVVGLECADRRRTIGDSWTIIQLAPIAVAGHADIVDHCGRRWLLNEDLEAGVQLRDIGAIVEMDPYLIAVDGCVKKVDAIVGKRGLDTTS